MGVTKVTDDQMSHLQDICKHKMKSIYWADSKCGDASFVSYCIPIGFRALYCYCSHLITCQFFYSIISQTTCFDQHLHSQAIYQYEPCFKIKALDSRRLKVANFWLLFYAKK